MILSCKITFSEVPIGAEFFCNGNRCVKVSSRTADLQEYGRRFYFGMRELVTVSKAPKSPNNSRK